jgi:Flp pilus assembly protein TadD
VGPEQARAHHGEALELYRRFGYRRGEAKALNGLAAVALTLGEFDQAEQLYGAALEVAVEVGNRAEQSRARAGLDQASNRSTNPSR